MQYKWVASRLQELEVACRENRLPVTAQRRMIFEELLARDDHPTADQIYEAVRTRMPQLSRTTIYRTLDTFVELGVIRRVAHAGGARYDANTARHHHLVCSACGKMADVLEPSLDQLTLRKGKRLRFRIDDHSVHFTAICADCQSHS